MPSITKPRFWLLTAAAVSALWITFRVVAVDAAPRPHPAGPTAAPRSSPGEVPDPALDALIHRFAREAADRR